MSHANRILTGIALTIAGMTAFFDLRVAPSLPAIFEPPGIRP
jgi:hypothetical protein